MFVPVIVRPTSPGWKLAVADVTVPEPDEVAPSVTVREVVFSSVHLRPVKVPVAFALSTACVASVNVLMNVPAGRPDAVRFVAGVQGGNAQAFSDADEAQPLIG
jgi:hypothetical protein